MGKAMMGTGEAQGEGRAIEAAEAAISSPLLDDVSMQGAKAVLINITGGLDMTLYEVDEAANRIREEVDPDAHIIFGSTFDESLHGKIRVSCVATGIDAQVNHVINKSRISQMEEEFRTTPSSDLSEAPQEEGTEVAATLPENEIFEEAANASLSEELSPSLYSDDFPKEDEDYFRKEPEENSKPLGFFSRLMGRKTHDSRGPIPASLRKQESLEPTVQSLENQDTEEESIEIPAFLRRQSNR